MLKKFVKKHASYKAKINFTAHGVVLLGAKSVQLPKSILKYHTEPQLDTRVAQTGLTPALSSSPQLSNLRENTLSSNNSRYRAPSSKKWNFRTKFLENFRTLVSVSRGSRHRKRTFFCAH